LSLISVIALLLSLGWSFLLTSVGLGITHGEMRIDTQEEREQATRLDKSANLALALFVAVEIALGIAVVAFRVVRLRRLHWTLTVAIVAVAASAVSYGLVLASLSLGGAPDFIELLQQKLSKWLTSLA
jgi:hypothetical protein